MDSVISVAIGYLVWCVLAFVIARFLNVKGTDSKAISFLYIVLSAPLVVVEFITGKGIYR